MFQFFVNKIAVSDKQVRIEDDNFNHMKNVLRMKEGEEFFISVKKGDADLSEGGATLEKYICTLHSYEQDFAICDILSRVEESNELPCEITLYQGLPKSDKMEMIIQKAVELGVTKIVPVAMEFCIAKLEDKKAKSKVDRWNAIAEAAAKQSKRDVIPTVEMPIAFRDCIDEITKLDVGLLPYEHSDGMDRTRRVINNIKQGDRVGILVGPEGGFSKKEIDHALSKQIEVITLGKRILRAETASLSILSMIGYVIEG